MSQPGEQPELPETTLIEQEGTVPETVEIPEEKPEAPDAPEGVETKAEEKPAEESAKQKPWFQKRFDKFAHKVAEAERRATAAEARLAELEKPAEGEQAPLKPEQFEAIIEQRAEAKLAAKTYEQRAKSWVSAGQKEYGAKEFDSMCSEVADMGAGDSREFMQLVTDPDIIPDGHKIIAQLREDPDEAERIFALEPIKMAAALTRLATKEKPTPVNVSKAPRPITPTGGSAKPSGVNDSQDMKTWLAERNKTARTTAGGKPNTH